jgi:hypothetical protein
MNHRSTLVLSVLGSALCAPLAVAQTPQLEWRLEATPPSRNLFNIARHDGIDATVVFGGEAGEEMDDTWLWRNGWLRVDSPVAPSRRSGAGMAYDSTRQRLVLFGGRSDQSTLGDTWVFDGAAWTQLLPPQSPPSRWGHAIGYDPVRDRVVVKSGLAAPLGVPLADLWEFDGLTWQQRPQSGANPGGGNAVGRFVFDAPRQDLLLVGGAVTAWNGTTWSPRSTTGLPANTSGTPTYDQVGQRVLLFAATESTPGLQVVYGYQGLDWTEVASAPVASDHFVGLAYDPVRGQAVGLRTAGGPGNDDRSHTFLWRNVGQPGTGWQLVQSGLPPGRGDPAMGYDPQRRRTALYGGEEGIFTSGDLYEADDRLWWPRTGFSSTNYHSCAFAYDSVTGRLLLVGHTGGLSVVVRWDGSVLASQAGGNTLPVRHWFGLAYHTAAQRLLLFGGDTETGLSNQLWSWNGATWTDVTTPGPAARRSPAMCYDAGRNRLVLFGGTNSGATAFFGDTWEHDGTAWEQRTPLTSPGPRAESVLVYASHLQRCVLVGGFSAQDHRDTWLWDGSDWTPVATVGQPDTGTGIGGVYDPDRREVIVFGGGTYLGTNPRRNRGELWRLVDPSLATWTRHGIGCDAGAGLLQLEALDPPAIDTTCRFELRNTPNLFVALPLAWIGFDDQQWGGIPLPFSLAALGAPNCFVWADPPVMIPLLPLGSRATGELVLPDAPAALGLKLHLQGMVWNFATSSIATADLLTGIVGPQ